MAQISLTRSGAFCSTSFPIHGRVETELHELLSIGAAQVQERFARHNQCPEQQAFDVRSKGGRLTGYRRTTLRNSAQPATPHQIDNDDGNLRRNVYGGTFVIAFIGFLEVGLYCVSTVNSALASTKRIFKRPSIPVFS